MTTALVLALVGSGVMTFGGWTVGDGHPVGWGLVAFGSVQVVGGTMSLWTALRERGH